MLHLMLVFCLCADQEAVPENVAKWKAELLRIHKNVSSGPKQKLDALMAAKRPSNGPKRKAYDAQLKAAQEEYTAASEKAPVDYATDVLMYAKPNVGDIAFVEFVHVVAVLDAKRAIVEVKQNFDVAKGETKRGRAILTGVDTSKWADDRAQRLDATFEVYGIDKSTGESLVALKQFDVEKWRAKITISQPPTGEKKK